MRADVLGRVACCCAAGETKLASCRPPLIKFVPKIYYIQVDTPTAAFLWTRPTGSRL